MGPKHFLHTFLYDLVPEIPIIKTVLQQLETEFLEKPLLKHICYSNSTVIY